MLAPVVSPFSADSGRSGAGPCAPPLLRGGLVVAACAAAAMLAAGCAESAPSPSPGGGTPVWIDADPSIGEPDRDVDDGFALVQAFQSDGLDVRGVSTVFGRVPLVRSWPITQDLVTRFGPEGLRPWRGAANPQERRAPTEASEALATALRREPLTIIALGPLTNVASTLERDPDLRSRVVRIVAVAGLGPEGPDATATADARDPRRDLNVALDVEAMRLVLDSGVPVTLTPSVLAAGVSLTGDDLTRLEAGPAGARFLAEAARGWLRARQDRDGVEGIHPASTVAVDVVASPGRVGCDEGVASIERVGDVAGEAGQQGAAPAAREALVVRAGGPGRPVTYCHTLDSAFKERLLSTLLTGR